MIAAAGLEAAFCVPRMERLLHHKNLLREAGVLARSDLLAHEAPSQAARGAGEARAELRLKIT